jgi:hypothetical protein
LGLEVNIIHLKILMPMQLGHFLELDFGCAGQRARRCLAQRMFRRPMRFFAFSGRSPKATPYTEPSLQIPLFKTKKKRF